MRFSVTGEGQIRKALNTDDEQEAHEKAAEIWHRARFNQERGMKVTFACLMSLPTKHSNCGIYR
jgi:hypothetical protein